jgi:hypothetical protein
MAIPFLGTEAIASGKLTRGQLRWRYTALHPNVYLDNEATRSVDTNAYAAWLFTRRAGIIAGRAAAYLYGVLLVKPSAPVEIIAKHGRRRPGIVRRDERIEPDEMRPFGPDGLLMTPAARTALDLARFLPRDTAVVHLDALAAVTGLTYRKVSGLVERYRGTRGIAQARIALELMDGGSSSPELTRLRLVLLDAGIPVPGTDVMLSDGLDTVVLPMAWTDQKVALTYDLNDKFARYQAAQRVVAQELLQRLGWFEIHVLPQHPPYDVQRRVRAALKSRS